LLKQFDLEMTVGWWAVEHAWCKRCILVVL